MLRRPIYLSALYSAVKSLPVIIGITPRPGMREWKGRPLLRSVLYSVFSLLMVSSHGQQLLTLEEAIATVLQNNYDIQLARNDSAIAALNYSYRNAVFLPRLNANVSNAWNNNSERSLLANDSIRKGSGIKLDNFNTAVILNWKIGRASCRERV